MKKEKAKHIVFLVSNDLSFDQRMSRICTTLSSNGFDVTLCGREKSESWKLENKGYRQHRIKTIFESGPLFYLALNVRLFFYLLFRRIDGVCAIDLDTATAAWLIAKVKRKILIYDAHELFTDVPELLDQAKKKKIWEWVARTVIPASDLRYTVNESLAEVFKKRYGYRFHSIQNLPLCPHSFQTGLAPTFLQKWKKEERFILLYQGWLNKGRGVEQAFESITAIPNTVLVLAGRGDLEKTLKTRAKDLGISERVRFLGWVAPTELQKLTFHADCGLNLLESESENYYYSLANKHLDYIMAGIPSISMNFPEYKRINEKAEVSILLEKCDSTELSRAITKLIEDKGIYDKLSSNAKELRLQLNWQKEEEKLVEMYKELFLQTPKISS